MTAPSLAKTSPGPMPANDADEFEGYDSGPFESEPVRRPPNDMGAEGSVLGAVLIKAANVVIAREILRPEDFYSEAHRRVFEAVLAVTDSGQPVDTTTVGTWLMNHDRIAQVGGMGYLTELLNFAPAVLEANLRAYAGAVRRCATKRAILVHAQETAALCHVGTIDADTLARDTAAKFTAVAAGVAPIADPNAAWSDLVTTIDPEWLSTPPPKRSWLLRDSRRPNADGVLPLGKVGMLLAEGGIGKTMSQVQFAVAVATGGMWLDTFSVASPGRTLLILGEEDAEEGRRRLFNAVRSAKVAHQDVIDNVVLLPLAGIPCSMIDRGERQPIDSPFLVWLRTFVRDNGPFRLIVVDPLSRFAGQDAETDNAAATRFIQALESLATISGATVLVTHHTNKASRAKDADVDGSSSRGSTALGDGGRWTAILSATSKKVSDPDAQERLGEIVTFKFGKSNYNRAFEPVTLRRDIDNGGALVALDDVDRTLIGADAATERPSKSAKNAEKKSAITEFLARNPGASQRNLIANVDGRDQDIRACVDELVRDGVVRIEEGANRARNLRLVNSTTAEVSSESR